MLLVEISCGPTIRIMRTVIKWTILCWSVLFMWSCKKLQLTRATEKGAQTFSCIVGGKVFKPDKSGWFGGPPLNAYPTSNGFYLDAYKSGASSSTPGERIELWIDNLTGTGTYLLNTMDSYAFYELNYSGGPHYQTNESVGGSITITRYDTLKEIYSGKFHFSGIDTSTGKIIKVTNGRFDVKTQ